jgi:hypothetical protein
MIAYRLQINYLTTKDCEILEELHFKKATIFKDSRRCALEVLMLILLL